MKTSITLTLVLMLLFSSCASYPKYETFDTYIDFEKYSQVGFFLSIDDYNHSYMPKGLLSVSCYSGVQKTEVSKPKDMFNDDLYYSSSSKFKKEFRTCRVEELLDEIVNEARSKGADGLVNVKIVNTSRMVKEGNKKMKQPGLLITGFAIKKLE